MNKYKVVFSALQPHRGCISQRLTKILEGESEFEIENMIRDTAWVFSIDVRNFEITEIEKTSVEIDVSPSMIFNYNTEAFHYEMLSDD